MGARGGSSQSAKVRILGPPIKAWLALAAVLAGVLLVLAALAGTRPTGSQPVDVLPVVGDPIEETLRRPAVAAFLAAVVLVLLVAAVRGARLRWLSHSPGPESFRLSLVSRQARLPTPRVGGASAPPIRIAQ